jgi:uncharacterized protein YehS (DUF1456 family)
MRSYLMKVNEATLQNILKAYGQKIRAEKRSAKLQDEEPTNKDKIKQKSLQEELDIINYDQEGKVNINPQKKDALIDFFE